MALNSVKKNGPQEKIERENTSNQVHSFQIISVFFIVFSMRIEHLFAKRNVDRANSKTQSDHNAVSDVPICVHNAIC